MKKRLALVLPLAALCASPVAMAADTSAIKPLSEATRIMDNCAVIAKRISSLPVPKDHDAARAAEHYNEVMKEASKAAGGDPKSAQAKAGREKARDQYMKSIPPEAQAFMTKIRAERDELRKCGEQYAKVNASSHALAKKTSDSFADESKKPTEDDKKVGAAVVAYLASSEKLTTEIAALSKDLVHQRYVHGVIAKYFLGQDEGAPAKAAKPTK